MKPILFSDAATQFIENLELENGRNIPIKRRQLRQELTPFFGPSELASITRFDVERFKRHMLTKDFSPATVNRYLSALSNLFHKGVEWGWLEKLPCKIVKYQEENQRITYLQPEEIQALLEKAAVDPCPVIEPFIRIALGTAMRRTEILSIRLEHIDCANWEIYIPKAKCGARTQPMTASLATYLENHLQSRVTQESPFLFPSPTSKSGYRQEIEQPFRRVVSAAGMDPKKIVRHTLRHTAITHLVQAGVDLPTVQRFSGHRSIQMVFRYSHHSKEHLHQALAKMDARCMNF